MARLVNLANFTQFAAINLTADPGYDPSNRVIPNCAEIRLNWVQENGRPVHNVLHGSYSGTFNGSQAQANSILAALTSGANWTAMQTFLGLQTALTTVSIRNLGVAHSPYIDSLSGGASGTTTGTSLPNEVAAVITLRTASNGPQFRGRIYVPGFASNALGAGNTIAATAVTAIGNWGSIIAGALQAQGYIFGIAHFSRLAYTGVGGAQHPARPAGLVPITSVVVRDNHWDTQRRRGLK
jgi:hypothetical protein